MRGGGGIWVVRGKRVDREGRGMQREGELVWAGGGNENERRRGSVVLETDVGGSVVLKTDVERQCGNSHLKTDEEIIRVIPLDCGGGVHRRSTFTCAHNSA